MSEKNISEIIEKIKQLTSELNTVTYIQATLFKGINELISCIIDTSKSILQKHGIPIENKTDIELLELAMYCGAPMGFMTTYRLKMLKSLLKEDVLDTGYIVSTYKDTLEIVLPWVEAIERWL